MLEVFKNSGSFLSKVKSVETDIIYLLDFDQNGAFISVANSKFKVLDSLDYHIYSGIDREILYLLSKGLEESFFTVSWDESDDKVYLHQHQSLLNLLKKSIKVFSAKSHNLIKFLDRIEFLSINITPKDKAFEIVSMVDGNKRFKFISSDSVLIDDVVYSIYDIGQNFKNLEDFSSVVKNSSIEEVLSILFTHFQNLNVNYQNYKIEYKNESKSVKPTIIFEEITTENELIFKFSATIGKLLPQFFSDFSITNIAFLNDLEKSISIYSCDFTNVFEQFTKLNKLLSSIKRSHKGSSFSLEEDTFVLDEEIAKDFIFNHLHSLLSSCELFGSEKLKKYRYNTTKPTLNVSFKDKINYLGVGDVIVTIEDEKFNIFELIKLYKKHNYIPLKNGEKSILDKNYISKLERIFKKDKDKIKVSFFDLPEVEEMIAQKEQKPFKDSRKFYEGFNKLKSSKIAISKLKNVQLREYQKYGVKWLKYLYNNKFGGCLADDMGLGKTLQAIMLLSSIYPKTKEPSLIVMPKSLLINWQNEIEKFNPNLKYYSYYGTQRDIKEFQNHQIILTTYAIVRNDIKELQSIEFDTIILDESQHIKNIESKASKAVMLLSGKHKFALSGTPIENSLFELYSLFRFLNEGMFSSLANFKRDYVVPITSEANEDVAKVLKAKISPFLLRRLKEDVLNDLPPKQEQIVYVDMSDEHKALYNERRDYYKALLSNQIQKEGITKSRFAILQAFNDLRQIASAPELKSENEVESSKIEQLFDMLEDIIASGHKVLLFANFLGSLDLIAQKANELDYKYLLMTGSTRDRASLVDKFQNDDSYKLFLMTLKVGGVGLNLTKADYVFIFDPWWNKAAENQAIDRAHRIGQKNRVFSYKMITKNTIEEKIIELQKLKSDLTDMIISGDESGLKTLSQSDLDYILS